MSTLVVRKSDGQEVSFRDTIGHQIGNGAVQVMKGNGEQVIYNNFIEVKINLSPKEKQAFKNTIAKAEANAQAKIDAMEKAEADRKENGGVPTLSGASAQKEGANLKAVPKH